MLHYSEGLKIIIPTEQEFINQFYNWIFKEVSRHFKTRKDRVPETVQDIMIRLLGKKFIGRWFYRHLTDEMLSRDQAEKILGGTPLSFVDSRLISPVYGKRSEVKSLWKLTDILNFAKFDFDRYYYSVQNHTIDSDRVLELLGYPPGSYSSLQSMWRQGKIRPSELTEHSCTGKNCLQCKSGLAHLRSKGVSLANDWSNETLRPIIRKMRWNDSQLSPFLRNWRNQNRIFGVPSYVVRLGPNPGIQAGLLKYVKILINNEVNNCFKRMARGEDVSTTFFNKGICPDYSTGEVVVFGTKDASDGETSSTRDDGFRQFEDVRDVYSMESFRRFEESYDLERTINTSSLTDDEIMTLRNIECFDATPREVAHHSGVSPNRVNRIHTSALDKIRRDSDGSSRIEKILQAISLEFDCPPQDILSNTRFGRAVVARAAFFHALFDSGIPVSHISSIYGFEEERVSNAIKIRSKSYPPPALSI